MNNVVTEALKLAGLLDSTVQQANLPVCERIRYSVIYTTAAKKGCIRDGSMCVYIDQSTLQFGSIVKFCFCNEVLIAVINVFECSNATLLVRFTMYFCSKFLEISKVGYFWKA